MYIGTAKSINRCISMYAYMQLYNFIFLKYSLSGISQCGALPAVLTLDHFVGAVYPVGELNQDSRRSVTSLVKRCNVHLRLCISVA